ncbi:hypothetical protein FRX31_020907, partial [Thalictrum thalictroides]
DVLNERVMEGSINTEGKNDVLTMALGIPEHNGSVRAVGKGVTPTVSSRKPMGKDRVNNKERIKQDNIRNLDCNAQSSFDSFEETLHLMYPNETDHIKFPIGKDVFAGEDMEFGYIPKHNILDVCQMKDLDSDILIVYMR